MTKRILMTVPWSSLGMAGAERSAAILANGLSEDFEILLVAVSREKIQQEPLCQSGVVFKNIVGGRARYAIREIANAIKEFSPDIILGHVSHLGTNTLIAKHIARSPAIFVSVNHGTDTRNFLEMIHVYTNYLFSDSYVVVSEGMRQVLGAFPLLEKRHISRIYNGLDVSRIKNLAAQDAEDRTEKTSTFTIVSIGRLVKQKSFHVLIEAVAILRKQLGVDVSLLLIGEGEERLALEALSSELDVEDHVNFLGWRSNPFPFIRNSDVFVLSSYFEGFGYVLVEALACGKTIVSTDCPSGPSEILGGGDFGVLVPVQDPCALAVGIEKALNNPFDERDQEARADFFSESKMIQEYKELIAARL